MKQKLANWAWKRFAKSLFSIGAAFWPILSHSNKYGVQESMEIGASGGNGLVVIIFGAATGGAIGYAYSLYHNASNDKKFAADGCIIIGCFVGAFILPFLYIAVTK